jgi:hypothetical protein
MGVRALSGGAYADDTCIFAIILHTCIQYPGQSPACEDNVWANGVLALAKFGQRSVVRGHHHCDRRILLLREISVTTTTTRVSLILVRYYL